MISSNMLKKHSHMSEKELYQSYRIFFGTLVSDSRLRILNLLRGGRKNVSELIGDLNKDQTSVSHDLARLKQCGFVKSTVEGKYRYYVLNEDIEHMMNIIEKHMSGYCVHILHGMKGGHTHGKH